MGEDAHYALLLRSIAVLRQSRVYKRRCRNQRIIDGLKRQNGIAIDARQWVVVVAKPRPHV